MYALFNKTTNEQVGKLFTKQYLVDGKPVVLPDDMIMLEVNESAKPNLSDGQSIIKVETPDIESGKLNVSYQVVEPTPEKLAEINANKNLINEWNQWNSILQSGYRDEQLQIKLKTTEEAQTAFTSMITLINEALTAGVVNWDTIVSVWDFDGKEQQVSVTNLKLLLLRYGLYCKQMFDLYKP